MQCHTYGLVKYKLQNYFIQKVRVVERQEPLSSCVIKRIRAVLLEEEGHIYVPYRMYDFIMLYEIY